MFSSAGKVETEFLRPLGGGGLGFLDEGRRALEDGLGQFIADRVSEGIIDAFEVIEIHHQ